jgi:FixJ family two-component response regulator
MGCRTIFIISEDPAVRDSLSELVVSAGLRVQVLPSFETWLETVRWENQACLVLDICPGDLLDPQRCAQFTAACARMPVVVVTDRGDVPAAVRALKGGAADVIQKPLQGQNLLERIERAVARNENGSPIS